MKNYLCEGERVNIVGPSGGLISGQPYLMGRKVVVMVTDAPVGVTGVGATEGVFVCAKATGAVTQGALLYWDDTAKNFTTTSTSNVIAGWAFADAASGDATVQICLTDNAQ